MDKETSNQENLSKQSGEKDLIIFRQSRDRLYLDLAIVALAFIGLCIMFYSSTFFNPIVLIILFFIIILVCITVYVSWYFTIFKITTIRVEYKSGLISKIEEEIALEDIQTVDTVQSLIGRLLNHGDIKIESAGNNIIILKNVHNAHNLAHQIATLSLNYNKSVEIDDDHVPFDKDIDKTYR